MRVDLSSCVVDAGDAVDGVSEGGSVVPRGRAVGRDVRGRDHYLA